MFAGRSGATDSPGDSSIKKAIFVIFKYFLMRFLRTLILCFISFVSFGQGIYSSTNGHVTLGDSLNKVLANFDAKKGKGSFYHNKPVGYSFGLDQSSRLIWFSTDKAAVTIGDGSIKCGIRIDEFKKITTSKVKTVKLFGDNFIFISGLDNFPNTEFIVFIKDKKLVEKLRELSTTDYRNDNGVYRIPMDAVPDNLKINSIRVTKTKI
jgi:hypothetical protein